VLGAALVVALSVGAGGLGGYLAGGGDEGGTVVVPASSAVPASTRFSGEALDVSSVLDKVGESVVSVQTVVRTQRGRFVQEGEGAGTGVVMDSEGHVLTNAHVVEGATSVTVTLGDGDVRAATVVASDASADIAVLLVEDSSGMVPADFADDEPAVGDQVIAIGNALALEGGMTVTQGIVSALDRSIETNEGELGHLIQTDAAISSGNSGGALVDAAGQVVGINTAVAASGGSTQASNIGFAIAIERALAIADELLGASTSA
jgi:S1-C subfamily serine protease